MTGAGFFGAVLLAVVALALPAAARTGGSPEKDRDILVRFRDSITNWDAVKQGGNLDGWDDATPTYLWAGVVLDFDLRVREIKMPCFDFMYCIPAEGPIFKEFAQLERLETLHLSGNHFTGDLPDEWAAPGAFPVLQSLSLSSSHLNGALPRSWGTPGSWPALKELGLDGNNFTGQLPPEWGNRGAFPKLEKLALDGNSFSGSLPVRWGDKASAFPLLQTLTMAHNRLTGELPPVWGSSGGFSELVLFSAASCGLEGSLPSAWAAPDRFPKLATLEVRVNNISGPLPLAWGCEGCFPALQELYLMNNSLSGVLPDTWGALGTLRILDISHNNITGSLPDQWATPGAMPQLSTLSLFGNAISGGLPSSWGRPEVLPALSWLDVKSNNISGSLPDSWGVPNSFPRLRLLDLKHNNISGTLPAGWSFNSTLQQLFTWSLAHNALTGSLPDEWGLNDNSLAALYVLDVSYNRLNGSLPPSWGAKPSALSSLTSLSIAGNDFSGEIPKNWGFMPAMHYLVLAPGNNHVCRPLPYSGQFVTCLGEDSNCKQPVQLRSNCSSDLPGWVPYKPDSRGSGSLTSLQIGLIVSGVSLVAACSTLIAVLVLRYREQRRWQTLKGMDAELALRDGKDPLAELIAATAARKRGAHNALAEKVLKECRIDQADIMFCRGTDGNLVQLGAGAYGQVYKAFLYGVHPVAVKVFQTQDDVPVTDFWKEISILRTCRHNNIVQFQGACVDGDTTMMVTELMDTDLYRALQTNRVNWYRHGHDVAIDVAQALHFLHCRNIIHFDCKSPNILLSATNQAKLADVGWAQILYHSYITGDGGTFNWAAPEQLIGLKCTAKADVYSFGLVLWELCTRELPVRGQIRDIRIPQEAPQMVADLIRECLDVDPAKRPTMEQIIHRLQAEKERLAREGPVHDSAGGSSSGYTARPSTHRRLGAGSQATSSLDAFALEGIPGASLHDSSEKSSAFREGTSSGQGRGTTREGGSSSGAGAGSSAAAGASRGGAAGAASIDSSLWRAGSTPPAGSQASDTNSLISFDGMPVGGSSSAHSGGSGPSGGSGTIGRTGTPSYDGMSVGAGLGHSTSGSGWHAGSSSQGGGGSSSGNDSVFAGSAWAAGRPALAATAGAAAATTSIFEGSAWAAGRPAMALNHAGGSSTVGGTSVAGGSSVEGAGGTGGVFQNSPWWTSGSGTSQGGSQAGASGSQGGSLPGGASLAATSHNPSLVQPNGSSGIGSEEGSLHSGLWMGAGASHDSKEW